MLILLPLRGGEVWGSEEGSGRRGRGGEEGGAGARRGQPHAGY